MELSSSSIENVHIFSYVSGNGNLEKLLMKYEPFYAPKTKKTPP